MHILIRAFAMGIQTAVKLNQYLFKVIFAFFFFFFFFKLHKCHTRIISLNEQCAVVVVIAIVCYYFCTFCALHASLAICRAVVCRVCLFFFTLTMDVVVQFHFEWKKAKLWLCDVRGFLTPPQR